VYIIPVNNKPNDIVKNQASMLRYLYVEKVISFRGGGGAPRRREQDGNWRGEQGGNWRGEQDGNLLLQRERLPQREYPAVESLEANLDLHPHLLRHLKAS
jgi:hypothetical protein